MIHILLGSDDSLRSIESTHEDHNPSAATAPVRARIEIEDGDVSGLCETWHPGQRSVVYEVVR